jgi:hypothetical protein
MRITKFADRLRTDGIFFSSFFFTVESSNSSRTSIKFFGFSVLYTFITIVNTKYKIGNRTIPRIIVSPRTDSPYFITPRIISLKAHFPENTFPRVISNLPTRFNTKNVTRRNDIRGNVTRGNEIRGNLTQGNEIRENVTRGNEIRGSVTRGNEIRGNVTRRKAAENFVIRP